MTPIMESLRDLELRSTPVRRSNRLLQKMAARGGSPVRKDLTQALKAAATDYAGEMAGLARQPVTERAQSFTFSLLAAMTPSMIVSAQLIEGGVDWTLFENYLYATLKELRKEPQRLRKVAAKLQVALMEVQAQDEKVAKVRADAEAKAAAEKAAVEEEAKRVAREAREAKEAAKLEEKALAKAAFEAKVAARREQPSNGQDEDAANA